MMPILASAERKVDRFSRKNFSSAGSRGPWATVCGIDATFEPQIPRKYGMNGAGHGRRRNIAAGIGASRLVMREVRLRR